MENEKFSFFCMEKSGDKERQWLERRLGWQKIKKQMLF
ncbi:hypothetical protein ELI_2342 [Eubacterium callanderi]|uniref:Uncharacterized protein n=1 Tax=Eubacterium callanderi TaxID=53442 RepID=E3GNT1_9FIRM|nr:hypothetical protein ELI_2342 [Eubacterium callanderi]